MNPVRRRVSRVVLKSHELQLLVQAQLKHYWKGRRGKFPIFEGGVREVEAGRFQIDAF